jgi:hypothetical protein
MSLGIHLQRILDTKGQAMLVKVVKEIKIILDCYLNSDQSISGRLSYNSLSYDYLPLHLRTIFKFIRRKDPTVIIAVGSFLSYTRMLVKRTFSPDEGLDTIEVLPTPLPVRQLNAFQSFSGHLHGLAKNKKAFTDTPRFNNYHLTSKGGPLDAHALMSSY